jgi:hypothetical protein
MAQLKLPKVGDIITFSGKWNLNLNDSDPTPNGLVVRINEYDTGAMELAGLEGERFGGKDGELFGTLAYPLSFDHQKIETSRVYVVEWATKDKTLRDSYRCINEEWFYNGVFLIISPA